MTLQLTNEIRLKQMAKETPLVTGDEKIAVFGACGQIGSKLRPVLESLYSGKVIYCDTGKALKDPKNSDVIDVNITNEQDVRTFLSDKKKNIKVVINLAALLSGAADQFPDLAHKINFNAPLDLMKLMDQLDEGHRKWVSSGKIGDEPNTIRKVQIMSSMASQEFGAQPGDSAQEIAAKQALQGNSSTKTLSKAKSRYGQQKGAIEELARYYVAQRKLDISIPCLAGVLNAHTPWPSNGTTEELDKMVVAAALHKVYSEEWEIKLRQLIIEQDKENGPKMLEKGHYIHDGKYIPEVTGDTEFAMIDGQSLAEAVLLLLHKDSRESAPVQNVYEYTSRMMDAASELKKLNPGFPVEFATEERNLPKAGIIEPPHLMECVDGGKMQRAKDWAHGMDTTETEKIIGNFKRFDEKTSIREQYSRAVDFFKAKQLAESSVAVAPKPSASALTA